MLLPYFAVSFRFHENASGLFGQTSRKVISDVILHPVTKSNLLKIFRTAGFISEA